jgi:hypothetical protein
MKRLLCIGLLLCTAPTVAVAQSVEVGSLVRISTEGQPVLQGLVTTVADDWIVVGPARVPIDSITELQVLKRRSNAGKGALIGGASLGALSGLALGVACAGSAGSWPIDCSDQVPGAFAIGALAGFTAGALLGGMIGAMIMSDAWEPVALDGVRVTIAPSRSGPMRVGLSLSF